ncbi:MAG: hypothetical protein KDB21_00735 [Acidimicrobiales bacterium]|nr:hypothetical protein [Acidimicrobiales bacterium]
MDSTDETPEREAIVPGVARALSPLVRRIQALNSGAHAAMGTNTYLVGIDEIVVIDPGPTDAAHLDAIAGCGGDRIRWIVCTSDTLEHANGAAALAERTGAEILDPADGDNVLGTEFKLTFHDAGGPSGQRRMILLEEERALFCGDVLDGCDEPSVPSPPADIAALRAALEQASGRRLRRVAPAHGYPIEDPKAALAAALTLLDAAVALAADGDDDDDAAKLFGADLDDDAQARALAWVAAGRASAPS